MSRTTTILRELLGLFVDDVRFAAEILIWVAIIGSVPPRLGLPAAVTAPALFLGLAAILIESAASRARRR